jgi:hypothetical protein
MERTVEIEMEAEECTIDPGHDGFRKILMKAIYGNIKTLPKDRHERLEPKLISTTEKTATCSEQCETVFVQIQKSTMTANGNSRNTSRQGLQQRKEYRWILTRNSEKMHLIRFDSVLNQIQMRMKKYRNSLGNSPRR